MKTTQPENIRLLVALTNLLLSQLADLRRLQADSEAATSPVTELLDQITDHTEQTTNEVKSRLSQELATKGYPPATATTGDAGQPRRGVDLGPRIRGFS